MNGIDLQILNTKKLLFTYFNHNTPKRIKNWHLLLKDYCGIQKKDYILNFKPEGKLFVRAQTNDKWQVSEIILEDDYKIYKQKPLPGAIIDLGSSIGTFTILAGMLMPQASIYSFEPDKNSFLVLRKNILLNKVQKKVKAFPWAASRQNGYQKFYYNKHLRIGGTLFPYDSSFVNVKTITLENIFKKNKISYCQLLKIDVEGSEYEILYSAPNSLFKKIDRIVMEYHNINKNSDLNDRKLKMFLEKRGYRVAQKKQLFNNAGYLYAGRDSCYY